MEKYTFDTEYSESENVFADTKFAEVTSSRTLQAFRLDLKTHPFSACFS